MTLDDTRRHPAGRDGAIGSMPGAAGSSGGERVRVPEEDMAEEEETGEDDVK